MPKISLIIFVLFFTLAASARAQTVYTPTLIRTIDTSRWTPPSPDACGLVWLPESNRFLVTDSEVDEMTIYQGANTFEMNFDGTISQNPLYTTVGFSNEPTDIAVDSEDPDNVLYYFTDDDQKAINAVNLGPDSLFRTPDDKVTKILTSQYGCTDPEGIAYNANRLFLACGVDAKIVTISLGNDGVLGGTDDTVTNFLTSGINQSDPEGIEYNPDSNTLLIVSTSGRYVAETTLTGTLIRNIDILPFNIVTPSGLEYAPSSVNPAVKSIYIAARGVDNNTNPLENDGKIYEISLSGAPTPKQLLLSWLLGTSDFDRNHDGKVNSLDFALFTSP